MPRPAIADDFFAFRTPSLPFDFLEAWSAGLASPGVSGAGWTAAVEADRGALRKILREAAARPGIREALFLASPDLEAALDGWLRGEPGGARVEPSLIKYLVRMASRPTPFGLFAGVSVGIWGADTCLRTEEQRRSTRLDLGYLGDLVASLEADPAVRGTLRYRPNTSLYEAAGGLRYTEAVPGRHREYRLAALEPAPYLGATLARAEGGAPLAVLAGALAEDGAGLAEASAYVHELIDNQVLVSDLQPALTGAEPLPGLVGKLRAHPETVDLGERLGDLQEALQALDRGGIGHPPARYRSLAEDCARFGIPIDLKHLFQVDLFRPAPGARLGPGVRAALEAGVDLLRRLAPASPPGPLDAFREAFRNRYDARWVPLSEVLDEDLGIGFQGSARVTPFPLLEGLPVAGPGPAAPPPFTRREAHLLKRLMSLGDAREWDLSDADLGNLENPDPPRPPAAFAALATLFAPSGAALDAGDFRFLLEGYRGPSGARLLGRFCLGDPRLEELVKRHLAAEERRRPEAVFAEVVHWPEGRTGNILCRPVLRTREIPFLGAGGAREADRILPRDLLVSVVGDRVVLRSRRLGREVLPRLSAAHDCSRGLALYRFLGALQDQDGGAGGWSWGCLEELPFLPRVRRGRHILARARWRFEAGDLAEVLAVPGAEGLRRFRTFREAHGLPRLVTLADRDREFLADLDNPLWTETLLRLVGGRAFRLREFPAGAGGMPVRGAGGRFCHELVIPFLSRGEPEPAGFPFREPAPPMERAFPPGSEWLYLKFYTSERNASAFLARDLRPVIEAARHCWDRWFFIRYADPGLHLRLRFHGDPGRLATGLLPRLQRTLAPWLAAGRGWKLQQDTYDPERERYGGSLGLRIAEEIFWHDSEAVLALLAAYPGLAGMGMLWRQGLKGVDDLMTGLGLDGAARLRVYRAARGRRGWAPEEPGPDRILGANFRKERQDLERFFAGTDPGKAERAGLAILAGRSRRMAPCIQELDRAGLLGEGRDELALSYAHMFLNRLLGSAPQTHEWAIYAILTRLLGSRLARS